MFGFKKKETNYFQLIMLIVINVLVIVVALIVYDAYYRNSGKNCNGGLGPTVQGMPLEKSNIK